MSGFRKDICGGIFDVRYERADRRSKHRKSRSDQQKISRRLRRRAFQFERLETRALLATITFGNSAGGNWNTASNWVGGVVPGANDDVVIPDFPGTPTITLGTGIANVKSLEIREAFVLSGGSLTATSIQQLAGSFSITGGTLRNSTLTQGTSIVSGQVSFQNVTIGAGATLTVQNGGRINIDEVSALTINGTGNFQSGSRVDFNHNTSVGFSEIIINSGGVVNATTADFNRAGFWDVNTRIVVNDGGRFISNNSTFKVEAIRLGPNVVFNAGDWTANRFDRPIYVPHQVIPLLSASGGGANNARFDEIHVLSGTLATGTLDLRAIGTETTANLEYWFDGDFIVATGATLNVFPSVDVFVNEGFALTVNGSANFQNGALVTLIRNGTQSFSELVVNNGGVVNAVGTSFLRGGSWNDRTRIVVNDGGRFIASNSTFAVGTMTLANNVVFNPGDWSGNKFDRPIYVPHKVIPLLSAVGGGADNARFDEIHIATGTLTTGTLDLRAIGTESTANLEYWFEGGFTVATGATLNVFPSVEVIVNEGFALTVNGSANFQNGAAVTFVRNGTQTFSELVVNNGGVVNAVGTSFLRGGSWYDRTRIVVNDGGRFIASNSQFSVWTTTLGNNVVFNPGDWSGNKFDRAIYVPHKVIPLLSAAGGGADNARFDEIHIATGTLATGTLDLRAIGTETTVNLGYWFEGGFTIATGATLNVFPSVSVIVNEGFALTVNGSANFQDEAKVIFQRNGGQVYSELVVNNGGVVNAVGTSFVRGGAWFDYTRIVVNNGGRFIASNSTFTVWTTTLGNNVVFNPGDWSGNKFDRPIYVPHKVIPLLSAAGGGADNARFDEIHIATATLSSGTLDLRAIGTETTANLEYWFEGGFTIATGATLNVFPGVSVVNNEGFALAVNGTANFQDASKITFNRNGGQAYSELVINNGGVVNAVGTSFLRGGAWFDYTRIVVNNGGRFIASNSTITVWTTTLGNNVVFNPGDWSGNKFDRPIYVPHKVIPLLSAAGGGADNARFDEIHIATATLSSGTLDLRAIGTETTANLEYWFEGGFTIATGATLNVFPGVSVVNNEGFALAVNGTANFQNGSKLTFNRNGGQAYSELVVNNGGVVNAVGTSFLRGGAWFDYTRIVVNDGGRFIASNSTFTVWTTTLGNNVLFNPGDWSGNKFDRPIYVPHKVIPLLSAAGGGADNARFDEIHITTGTLTTGSLDLRAMGTETTANLEYLFEGGFTVAAGATLNVFPSVNVIVNEGIALAINGTANLQEGSKLTLVRNGGQLYSELIVNNSGVVSAIGSSILRGGVWNDYTRITVNSGGTFSATNSTVTPWIFNVASGSNVSLTMENGSQKTVGQGGIDQLLVNVRAIDARFGSTLTIPQSLQVGASPSDPASLDISYSSTLSITGSLLGKTQTAANYLPLGRVLFNGNGTSAKPQLLEVMGRDLGATSAGFATNNFVYGKLELANNTYVRLTNTDVNSAVSEAIYVHTLIVPNGSKLDLNNQKLYVRAAQYAPGSIVNGAVVVDPTVVVDSGPLLFSLPTPGTIDAAQQLANVPDEWTFTATKNAPVMVQVNPGAIGSTGAVLPQLQRVTVELLDANNSLLKSVSNSTDGTITTLTSDPLTLGNAYKIRVRPFSTQTGNYVITLLNDDAAETGLSLAASIDSQSKNEGNAGSTSYTYTATRFGDISSTATVNWSVVSSGSTSATGADFTGSVFPSGTLSFAAQETTKSFTVQVAGDTVFEPDETFAVRLSNPSSGMAITLGEVVSEIVNDDHPQTPDLVVEAIAVPSNASAGQTVTLGWNEMNQGTVAATGAWGSRVTVTKVSTGQVIHDQVYNFTASNLTPQTLIGRAAQFAIPNGTAGAGIFSVTIQVDSNNAIVEQNIGLTGENNNIATSSFLVTETGSPDLLVGTINTPSNVQLNVPFEVNWSIVNSGTASLGKAIRDRVYLSADNLFDVSDRLLTTFDATSKVPLDVNASYSNTSSITLPLDGNFVLGPSFIIVVTDVDNSQFELNENNNYLASAISLNLPALPDLIVEDISTKALAVAGQTVNVSWT